MAAHNGRLWRLYIKAGITYVPFAGVREESMNFSLAGIDVSDKESDGYRHLLHKGGRSVDFSCSGVAIGGAGYNRLKMAVARNEQIEMKAETATDILTGTFQISGFTETGADAQAVTFSASFQSSAAYVYLHPESLVMDGELSPFLTATRASTATYFDAFGVMQTAANNEPRYDYDPVTGEFLGLLVEESRTNLFLYSEDFTHAVWYTVNSTVTANAALAPDGTTTMDKLVEDTANNNHYLSVHATSVSPGEVYVQSWFAKKAERHWFRIRMGYTSDGVRAWFDLQNGVIGTVDAGATAGMQHVGGGIYRCWLTHTAPAGAVSIVAQAFSQTQNNETTYTGDGTSGIYIWGAQIEKGSYPTSYIPTTSAQVTRAADSVVSNNFDWFNQNEGTVVCSFAVNHLETTSAQVVFNVSDGTVDNAYTLYARVFNNPYKGGYRVFSSGSSASSATFTSSTLERVTQKVAFGYQSGNYGVSFNGTELITATDSVLPIGVNRISVGLLGANAFVLSGHIKSLYYLPRRVSNTELQGLTS